MSENALCKLIDELRKNGVIAEISQVTMEKPEAFIKELRTIIELDFSLHDKVFEDRIADLENIINHKLGDWNKHGITYQEIMDMKAENQELKQITKGYENKITELKKDYKTASELLGKYQQENEGLKERIIELENFSCQAEQETESLVEELKQRIAELEKKKRKRPCFVSYVGVEEINGKEYVSMEKFATAMEELNAYFDKFFDS